MAITVGTITEFRKLFTGNENAYGVHIVDNNLEKEANGKVRGRADFTKKEPVVDRLYEDHINGGNGLGIIPIRSDGTVFFSVIDVDVYNASHDSILTAIANSNLPIVPFKSKSGGLHLYTFWQQATLATKAIEVERTFLRILGLSKKSEIFPKQGKIDPDKGDAGNWINLPYYDAEHTHRCVIRNGNELDIVDGIAYAVSMKTDLKHIADIIEALPLNDAPPCLQTIYLKHSTEHRNDYLFNFAVYSKAKLGDAFEDSVIDANRDLDNPIELDRLMPTITSVKKKSYTYKCKEEPLCSFCDKSECRNRKYGIGGSEVTQLDFGILYQVGEIDSPWYEWIVNGQKLTFFDENDIIKQEAFRKACFRILHVLPQSLAAPVWTEIVNNALVNMQVKLTEAGSAYSAASIFEGLVIDFLTKRVMATNRDQILADRVYLDPKFKYVEDGANITSPHYIFRMANLVNFLKRSDFRGYSQSQIAQKLVATFNAKEGRYSVAKTSVRAWMIPIKSVDPRKEAGMADIDIEFLDEIAGKKY